MSATDAALDRACKWAISAYRAGDARTFVADVLRIVAEEAGA